MIIGGIIVTFFTLLTLYYSGATVSVGFQSNLQFASLAYFGLALVYYSKKQKISTNVIFWFFNYIFFGLGALIMTNSGKWRYPVQDEFIVYTSIYILLFAMLYHVIYEFQLRRSKPVIVNSPSEIALTADKGFLLLIPLLLTAGYKVMAGDLTLNVVKVFFVERHAPLVNVLNVLFHFWTATVFYILAFKKSSLTKGRRWFSICVLLLIIIIAINPLSMNRTFSFMLFFPLVIIFARRLRFSGALILAFLFSGIFFSFLHTLFSIFLTGSNVSGSDLELLTKLDYYFYSGSFDSFENVVHAVHFVHEDGIFMGLQLIASLLFWVPRSMWLDKPTGSGDMMSYEFLTRFHEVYYGNISFPIQAEAYLNFGIFGLLVGAVLLSFLLVWIDLRLLPIVQHLKNASILANVKQIYLLYLPGLVLLSLRGDNFTAMSLCFGILLSYLTFKSAMIYLSRGA